jgi:hypothetical protein
MSISQTFLILQYNIRNSKKIIMMSLLINSIVKQYDVFVIQKFWRNVCVSTSYNLFNTNFHLTYHQEENVRICFYIIIKIDVNKWSMNFSFDDVYSLRLRTRNDQIINIHNVYNSSLVSYIFRALLLFIKAMKSKLCENEKHVLFKYFNLHHLMWDKDAKLIQHDAID